MSAAGSQSSKKRKADDSNLMTADSPNMESESGAAMTDSPKTRCDPGKEAVEFDTRSDLTISLFRERQSSCNTLGTGIDRSDKIRTFV